MTKLGRRACAGLLIVALQGLLVITTSAPAFACEGQGDAGVDAVLVEMNCDEGGGTTDAASTESSEAGVTYLEYRWASVCVRFDPATIVVDQPICPAARNCPSPDERLWELWGRTAPAGSGWEIIGQECFGTDEPPSAAVPTVTAGMVLEAIRQIGLPAVEAKTQPAGKTLVNFETIFYAEPQTFTRSLTLLGQQVEVEARPVEYRWHHGDGTVNTTTSPGAPYPAKDITYSYSNAHVTVDTRVDVTYEARFRVNSGSWQAIAETVTITGPANALRVAEAVPVLSGDYS